MLGIDTARVPQYQTMLGGRTEAVELRWCHTGASEP